MEKKKRNVNIQRKKRKERLLKPFEPKQRERRERNQIYFGTGVQTTRERMCRRRSLSLSPKLFLLSPFSPSCQRPLCSSFGTATIPNGGLALGVMTRSIGGPRWRGSALHAQLWCFSGRWKLIQLCRRRFYAGGGGLLRSAVAVFSFREEESPSAPPSPAFSYGEWRLAKLCHAAQKPGVLWVKVTSSICVKFGEVAVKVGVWVTADEISLDDEAFWRW